MEARIEPDDVERLIDLLTASAASELTVRSGESRITVRRPRGGSPCRTLVPYESADAFDEAASGIPVPDGADVTAPSTELRVIAPLVGLFQHVKPVVGLGARVNEGQVIGFIKAVNLINDITSPVTGTVTDLLVDDGLPVEYAQILFVIEPDE